MLMAVGLGVVSIVLPWPEFLLRNLVIRNADYFLVEPPSPELSYNKIQRLFLGLLDTKLQYLVAERLASQIQAQGTDADKAVQAVIIVRDYTLTQTDLIKVDAQRFLAGSVGKVALRGYGWCDQVNGVLMVVAHRVFDNVGLFGLYDKDKQTSPHAVVRANTQSGTIFMDAWNGARVFRLSDQLSVASRTSIPVYTPAVYQPDISGLNEQFFRDGYVFNQYDSFYRAKKTVERMKLILSPETKKASSLSNQATQIATTNEVPSGIGVELKIIYLDARLDHLLGNRDRALHGYLAVSKEECRDTFCSAAKLFVKRLANK